MDETQRISIEDFTNFNRCILKNSQASIRWEAAMEAIEEERKRQMKWNLDNRIRSYHPMFNQPQTT